MCLIINFLACLPGMNFYRDIRNINFGRSSFLKTFKKIFTSCFFVVLIVVRSSAQPLWLSVHHFGRNFLY